MRTTRLGSALAVCALLTACGSGTDAAITTTGPADSPTDPARQSPTPAPTAAPYPDFGPRSYTYVLRVSCFCAATGPVVVTVEDGKVVSAVDRKTGENAPEYRRITIDDVIDAANKADADGAARLRVRWRDGEAYPRSVYIDQDAMVADEEVGYTLSEVQVTS